MKIIHHIIPISNALYLFQNFLHLFLYVALLKMLRKHLPFIYTVVDASCVYLYLTTKM